MSELKKNIDFKTYKIHSGDSWPSFENFLQGDHGSGNIKEEIESFLETIQQKYSDVIEKSYEELSLSNQQRQRQVFFDKKVTSKSHCKIPWETLGINANGHIFICESPSWIPKFIGDITKVDSIYDILNCDLAKLIRYEIAQSRYYYCNNNLCAFFQKLDTNNYSTKYNDIDTTPLVLPDSNLDLLIDNIPTKLIFDFDYTCNFKCPSCRLEVINNNKDPMIRSINDKIVLKIKTLIFDKVNRPTTVRWCGGEPFISEPYLDLLNYSLNNKNIKHIIQTNGSYIITKQELIKKLFPFLETLRISFDAASEKTYSKIRVNGTWNKLLENVQYILDFNNRQHNKIKIQADFVVQYDNFREIPQFVSLCKELGIPYNLQKMWNWGTWPIHEFDNKNIYNPSHPEYSDLLEIFKQVGHNP